IKLQQKESEKLIKELKDLRGLGNKVVVVEQEEEIIRNADYLIDMGPYAGEHGGEVVYQGTIPDSPNGHAPHSLTLAYLAGRQSIASPSLRLTANDIIWVVE